MNNVSMTGRLGRDPELRFVAGSGKAVATFSIAVNRPHSKNVTDFFNVVVWNKPAENAAQYLTKGCLVGVRGYFTNRSYEDKTGQKRWATELVASDIEYLSRTANSSCTGQQVVPADDFSSEAFQQLEDDDDIPF